MTPSARDTTETVIRYDPQTYEVVEILQRGDNEPIASVGSILSDEQRKIVENNSRNVVYYGIASGDDVSGGVIFSERVFRESGATFRARFGDFTDQGLIIHELSHLVDIGASPSARNAFHPLPDSLDLIEEPRSSNTDSEKRADILTAGFMGNLSGDLKADFDKFLRLTFTANYNPNDYRNEEVPDKQLDSIPQ